LFSSGAKIFLLTTVSRPIVGPTNGYQGLFSICTEVKNAMKRKLNRNNPKMTHNSRNVVYITCASLCDFVEVVIRGGR
jgi:hypothetical protein